MRDSVLPVRPEVAASAATLTRASFTVRALAELAALGASAATVLWVARALGPESLGVLALALAFLAFAQALSDFGLPSLGAQLVVAEPSLAREVGRNVTRHRMVIASALTATMVLVSALPIDDVTRTYLFGIAVALLLQPFNLAWLLVSLGALKKASIVRVLGSLATLALVVVMIRGPGDAGMAVLLLVTPALVSAVTSVGLIAFGMRLPPSDGGVNTEMTYWIRRSRDYAVADLSVLAYTYADRPLLFLLAGPTAVGLYDAAHRLIQPFYAISVVVREAHFVDLADKLNGPRLMRTMDSFVRWMALLTIPVGPFLSLFSGSVIATLYGEQYADSALILALLGWTISIGYVSGIVVLPFLSWSRGRQYGHALLAGNIANLTLNLLAIPVAGAIGAAIASICSKAAVTVYGWGTFRQESGYPLASRLAPYLIGSGFASLLGWLVRAVSDNDVLGLIAFLAAYAGAVLLTWAGAHSRRLRFLGLPGSGR